jgi:hypothetical protein
MTLPNGENGLNPNIELAFATTSDGSIPARSTLDQQTVEALLKQRIKDSGGWSSAHDAAFDSLLGNASTPLFTRVIFTAIKALTNINLTPNLNIASIFDGIASETVQFLEKIVPPLDASKIGSGQVPQTMVLGLGDALTAITTDVTLANKIIDLKSAAGSNLMLNPDFGNMLITRFPYSTGVTQGYTLERWRSALSSWKWIQAASKNCGLVFAPTQALDTFVVKEGEKFSVECWIFQASGNVTTSGEIRLGVTFTDTSNELPPSDVFDAYALSNAAVAKGQWKSLKKVITVPPGYDKAKFWLYANTATPTGNTFYLDDVTLKEVVEAALIGDLPAAKITSGTFGGNFIEDLAIGASKLANAAVTNIKVALNAIATGNIQDLAVGNAKVNSDIDGTKIGSGAVAAARIGNLPAAKITSGTFGSNFIEDLAIGASKLANAAVTNIKVALDAIGSGNIQSLAVGNTKVAADLDASKIFSGLLAAARVGELPAAKITSGTFGSNFIEDLAIGASKLANAAVTNIKVALDAIATGNIQNLAVNNTKVNSDIDGTKIGSGAVAAARIGDLPAAKITTGTFGSNFIEDLAIGASKLANAAVTNIKVALDAIATGNIQNLAVNNTKVNSDIDGTKIGSGQVAAARIVDLPTSKITSGTFGSNFIEDLAIGASKLANAAVTNIKVALDAIATGNIQNLAVNNTKVNSDIDGTKIGSGQVAAARIVDLPTSKITSGTFGSSFIEDLAIGASKLANAAVTNIKVALNAIATGNIQDLAVGNAKVNSDIDGTKIGSGLVAEARVQNLTTTKNSLNLKSQDFSNLLPGSDFESATQLWSVAGQFSIATGEQSRSGTKSLKIVGTGSQNTIVYDQASPDFEVKEGDQLYIELWVKKSADYANTDTLDPRFRLVQGTGSAAPGTTLFNFLLVPSNIPTTNWTKLSQTYTIPAGHRAIQFFFTGPKASTMTGTLWVDDIVVRRVVKPDELAPLSTTKITSGTFGSNFIEDLAIGATKLANAAVTNIKVALDAIATGNIQNLAVNNTKVNSDIDGTKIGSGQVAAARIVDLPTSKITSGTFGSNFIEDLAIGATKLANAAVTNIKVALDAIATGNIQNLAVNNTKVNSDIDGTKIGSGQVAAARIVDLPTSKITSGTFGTSFIENLAITAGKIAALAVDNTKVAANLDASKIFSGQVAAARIGDLPAGKITTGTFGSSFIEDLAIGAGKLANAAVTNIKVALDAIATGNIQNLAVNNTKVNSDIDGTKIGSGQVAAARVGDLPAGKITSGSFNRSFIDVSDFTNLAAGSDFEGTTYPWTLGSNITIDSTVAYTGTKSLKFTGLTGSASLIGTNQINEGDQLYIELWARRDAAWNGGGSGGSRLRVALNPGNLNWTNVQFNATTIPTVDTWTKLTLVTAAVTPVQAATYKTVTATIFCTDATAGNLWIDDIVIRRINGSEVIKDNAIVSTKIANLAVGNSKVAADLDGTKITAGSVAEARIANLSAAKITSGTFGNSFIANLAIDASKLADAAVTNIKVALNAIATGNIQNLAINNTKVDSDIDGTKIGSGQVAAARIVDLPTSKITSGTFGTNFIENLAITAGKIAALAVDNSKVAADLDGTKITAGSVAAARIGNLPASKITSGTFGNSFIEDLAIGASKLANAAVTNIKVALDAIATGNIQNLAVGNTKVAADLDGTKITAGSVAEARIADLPASKITSGSFGNARIATDAIATGNIQNLAVGNAKVNTDIDGTKIGSGLVAEARVQNLTSTITTANTAQGLASTLLSTGGNLIPNGGFENTSFFLSAVQGSYSTEQALSGTRSLKLISNASSAYGYITSNTTALVRVPVSAGDILYVEYFVRGAVSPPTTNVQTTGGTNGIRMVISFRNAANGVTGSSVIAQTASTALNGVWTKVSGYTTAAPADTVGFYAYLELFSPVASGETYYFDEVIIRRTAKVPAGGITANEIAALAVTNAKIATGAIGTANIQSSAITANELAALAVTNPAIALNAIATGNIQNLAVGNAKINSDLDGTKITAGSVAEARIANLSAAKITSGTFGSSFIENLAITAGKLADAAVTNIKVALDAIATGNIQNLAVANTKVAADLDGTKITAGSVAEARIANLSAAKITSGTFGNARIATDAIATGNIQNLAVGNAKVNSDIDGTKIASGLVSEARVQNLTAARTDVQNTFNKLAGVLTNGEDSVTGSVIDNVVSALLKTYNTLQDHSRDIQDLKSEQSAAQVKGTSYQINFSGYSNGAFSTTAAPGTNTFFVIYSGAGTSSMGVQGGVGQWFNTNNADRNATIIWNKSTNTDFQILNGTMTTPPQQPAGGAGTPKFHAIGRVNSTGNTYVWARAYCDGFLSFKGEIGCTVAGTENVWATNIPLTWSLDMRFVLGVGTNARQYQIYSGSTLVWTHTESGTANVNYTTKNSTSAVQSTLGASNRQWGALAQIRGGTNGPYHSGKLSGASVADNESPAVKGSAARLYKNAGTQNYNGANADNVLTTFWDTVEYESPDIDADTATGTFRVTESKPYIISARVRLTSGVSSTCRLVLQRSTDNGATYPVVQHGIATSNCEGIGDSWVQYLNAGDRVRISARQSGINLGAILGSGQSETYFSITGAG